MHAHATMDAAASLAPCPALTASPPSLLLQTNAPILPIMLATKLLPEMEGEEEALLAQLAQEQQQRGAGADAAGASAAGAAGQPKPALSIGDQFAWVQDQERELNHLIDQLAREEDSLLGAKGERRKEMAAAVAKAAAAAPPGALSAKPAQQQQAQGRPGQQAVEAQDPLLAAVTYGAGLS